MTKAPRFAVETYTLCQGFVNCWTVNDQPQIFSTREAAQAELDEFLVEIDEEIAAGERAEDDNYCPYAFRIMQVFEP